MISISDVPSVETLSASDDNDSSDHVRSEDGSVFQLAEGLSITEVFSYSGPFVEDGSNEPCENILAVRIENRSEINYNYLKFELDTEAAAYTFTASSVMAGSAMTVLNEKRETYAEDAVVSRQILSIGPFIDEPSVHPESFRITYLDGFINLENLTDEPLKNVYVYYKNTDAYGFLGGITYRTHFETVEGCQVLQNHVENIHKDSSQIVFVTFEKESG